MAYTVFWAIPSAYLKGPAAAGGIALINTIGVLGGFSSPAAIGWLRTSTGSFRASLLLIVAIMAIGAALLAATRPSFASMRGKRYQGYSSISAPRNDIAHSKLTKIARRWTEKKRTNRLFRLPE
ncbi:hypothetical protein [Burkholderia ubonensis]|uniref:hypothetical protein n=1 Tax=Burkholderia ubonensis TaxID=101571 RepID=UPI0018DFF4DD